MCLTKNFHCVLILGPRYYFYCIFFFFARRNENLSFSNEPADNVDDDYAYDECFGTIEIRKLDEDYDDDDDDEQMNSSVRTVKKTSTDTSKLPRSRFVLPPNTSTASSITGKWGEDNNNEIFNYLGDSFKFGLKLFNKLDKFSDFFLFFIPINKNK